jgi:hypothetical protein
LFILERYQYFNLAFEVAGLYFGNYCCRRDWWTRRFLRPASKRGLALLDSGALNERSDCRPPSGGCGLCFQLVERLRDDVSWSAETLSALVTDSLRGAVWFVQFRFDGGPVAFGAPPDPCLRIPTMSPGHSEIMSLAVPT